MKHGIIRAVLWSLTISLAILLTTCGPVTPPLATATAAPTPLPSTEALLTPTPALASPTETTATTQAPELPTATPAPPTATPRPTAMAAPLTAVPPQVKPLPQAQAGPISVHTAPSVIERARWGGGWVGDAVYSPDGTQVALFTSLGIEFRDAASLDLLRFVERDLTWRPLALSPDWQMLALGLENHLQVRKVDGTVMRTLDGPPDYAEGKAAFSADGRMLASLAFAAEAETCAGSVQLWRVDDGAMLKTWEAEACDMAWSPDGKLLATWMAMSGLRIWGVPDGSLLHSVEGGALDACFSADGQSLAVAGFGTPVQLWRVSDWALLLEIEALTSRVRFSPDGTLLAFLRDDGTAQLVRTTDGRPGRVLGYGLGQGSQAMAFSPDGQVLALGSTMDVQFWRISNGVLLQALQGHTSGVASVAVSSDGGTVAFLTRSASSPDGTVQLWEVLGENARPVPNSADALSFAYSPDGTMLALGTWDFTVRLVRVPDGKVVRTLGPLSAQVQSVAFSPKGDLVAASAMEEVRLWQVSDGTLLHTWHVPEGGWTVGVTFSPDGSFLAAQSANPMGTVRVWRTDNGDLVQTFQDEESGYSDYLAFLSDGATLAVEKSDEVELWRIPEGTLPHRLGVAADAGPFAFSPDGMLLALSAGDVIQVWRVSDGDLLATLVGHTGWVGSVAFSPDGQFLATGSEDGTVRLWAVAAHTP